VLDDDLLTRCFDIAAEARAAGDHPFGSLLAVGGDIVAEARNRVVSDGDITAHAELMLVRTLERSGMLGVLGDGVVFASCEPCPMCVGAMFWAGARRVVYGLSSTRLTEMATPEGVEPFAFTITAPQLAQNATPRMSIVGPHREDDAAVAHRGFWLP